MPNLRTGFATVVIADKIYLIGGYTVGAHGVRGERLTSTEVYDPATKRWRLVPTPTAPTPTAIFYSGSQRQDLCLWWRDRR